MKTIAGPGPGTRWGTIAGLLAGFEEQEPSVAVNARPTEAIPMNNIIWIIGAIVVVIAILSFFGLR
jgi:hypothetical protein